MWLCLAESKALSVSSVMALTSLKTTVNLGGAAKWMRKPILPTLKKKGEPCLHSFKCSNCYEDHQADSNLYPFWKHRFNRKWHIIKYNEICENRFKSTQFSCEWHYTMNCDILKFFFQNVWKNKLIIDTILKIQFLFDIIFIQEPPWSTIHFIPSSNNCKRELLVGIPHHSNWLTFTRTPTNQSDFLRVLTYINIHVLCLWFSLQNNILNHRDVSCISFSN